VQAPSWLSLEIIEISIEYVMNLFISLLLPELPVTSVTERKREREREKDGRSW